MIYLASPYTPLGVTDPLQRAIIREDRFSAVCNAAAKLMQAGKVTFCPIAHSHPIEKHFVSPEGGEFWKKQDEPYLNFCTELVVLMLPGWEESTGVQHEIAEAKLRKIPISYMEP